VNHGFPFNRPRPYGLSRRKLLSRGALLLGSSLSGLGFAAPARTGTLDASKVKETVFPSGLRLVVKESRATDLAAVQVWIRAGAYLEDDLTNGTAHVIEHLVFKGSETGGPGSLDGEIENLGGLLEAATEKDWTRFSCTVSGRFVGKVLTVIADALRKPRLKIEDWEAEKPVVREELQQVQINPEAAMAQILFGLAFKKHPYRLDARGTDQVINSLDIQQVRTFFQKHYTPANMVVVVVGDVDPAGVEKITRAAFQADQPAAKTAAAQLPPEEVACEKAERRALPTGYLSGYVGLAFPAPSVKEPETHAMDLLLTMLEHGGQGRLPRAMRATGGVRATYETRRQACLFTVVAATGRSEPEPIEGLLRGELDFLSNRPIPPQEVEFAKRALHGTFALDNEPYGGQAGSLGYYAAIDRWQFASEYLEKIRAVTPEQIQETARKYLQSEHSVAVLFRPRPGGAPQPPRSGA
jgi:zinc protease